MICDLETQLSAVPFTPHNKDIVTLTTEVYNNGPLGDGNITVTVDIPKGYKYQSISSTSYGLASYSNSSKNVTWTMDTLAAVNSETLDIKAQAKNNGNRVFISDVSGRETDISPGNNNDNLSGSTVEDESSYPVSLIDFRGENHGNYNRISWSTASEINNNYFMLQKSSNGKDYQTIAKIDGAGNSNSMKDYSFRDKNPYELVTYYKLKQVDFDGQSETFDPITVKTTGNSQPLNVYPNPADKQIFIEGLGAGEEIILMNQPYGKGCLPEDRG